MSATCPTCGQTRENRSRASHNQYFAAVQEAFDNLPEDLAYGFRNADHLRRWALCKAGFCEIKTVVLDNASAAREVARLIRSLDEYAIVDAAGGVVTVYTAKSQSMRAMGKAEFQRSKDAVFDVLAELIGTDVASLKAARAA